MQQPEHSYTRNFVSYSGVKLPLKLVNELEPGETDNRNTFFRAFYDEGDQLIAIDKVVYGEVELSHRYHYNNEGTLERAEIGEAGDEPQVLTFD